MNETGEGDALSTLSAAVELALEQPFVCSHPGCSQRFSNPNRLDAHRLRHNMALSFGKDPVATPTGENTPTPTRFLRGDDSLGLFSELHDPNPFDESFRNLNSGKDITDSISVVGESSDVLTTPVIPSTGRVLPRSDMGARKTTLLQAGSTTLNASTSKPTSVHLPVSSVTRSSGPSLGMSTSNVSTTSMRAALTTVPRVSSMVMSTANVSAGNTVGGSTLSSESGLKMGQMLVLPGNMVMFTSNSGTGMSASLQQSHESSSVEENSVKTKLRAALTTRHPEAQVEVSHKIPLPPYDAFAIAQYMDSSSSEDGQDGKLNKLRERNRAAAARCREKKKRFMSDMERKYYGVEQQNALMQQQITQLRSEVAQLKDLLLLHKDCPVTKQLRTQQAMALSTAQNMGLGDTDGDDLAVITVMDSHTAHGHSTDYE